MKILITTFLLLVSIGGYSQTDTSKVWTGELTKRPMPIGKGGIGGFINNNISDQVKTYLIDNKIKGKLFIILVIGKDGIVQDAEISKGLDPIIDEEILKVVKQSLWTPGYHHETPVKTRISFPIVF